MNIELVSPNAVLGLIAGAPLPRAANDEAPATGLIGRLLARLGEELRYLRALAELRQLDDRDLDDLGVGRGQLAALARRHARGLPPLAPEDIDRTL
jgi:uncharacterized protein YjiS (DUF1127 family)